MILRKPYAILIKYFKLIHIIMFIFFGYFVFVLRKIYLFFSNYIKTGSFTYYENMVSSYIPVIVFFMIIIILALGIAVFLLMNKKEKPVLFYRVLIGYSVILLVTMLYFFFFFKSLDDTVYEPLRVVVNRDIILFIYIINYFFVVVSFIRGFGFDIKKFSFDKDKKELNLEESDNEEYELNVKIEKEDIANYIHRQKRELKYYFKENSTFFIIVLAIAIISISLYAYYTIFVVNKVYSEEDSIDHKGIIYKVNGTYITNIDKYGQEISKDSEYLIIDLNITNNQKTGYLDEQALRVHINEDYFYPSSSACNLFSDLGDCYQKQELKVNTSNNYIVVYKIKKEHVKIYLEILKNKGDEYQYYKMLLNQKEYEITSENYKVNDTIKIDDNEFKVVKYELLNKTTYQYEECNNDKCSKYTKNVLPNTGELVLAIEFDNIDKFSDDFITSAIGLSYGNTKVSGKEIKYIDKHDNTIYYSVSSSMKNKDDLCLMITTRNKIYNILLED